jgi:hypothetical protein
MGPMSSRGTIIGQGNFAEAKAMLKKAGNAIATSQRTVFHFSKFFFSTFFIQLRFLPLRLVRLTGEMPERPITIRRPMRGKTPSYFQGQQAASILTRQDEGQDHRFPAFVHIVPMANGFRASVGGGLRGRRSTQSLAAYVAHIVRFGGRLDAEPWVSVLPTLPSAVEGLRPPLPKAAVPRSLVPVRPPQRRWTLVRRSWPSRRRGPRRLRGCSIRPAAT